MGEFTADFGAGNAKRTSQHLDIPMSVLRANPFAKSRTHNMPQSVKTNRPTALNNSSPNRAERIPGGDHCQKVIAQLPRRLIRCFEVAFSVHTVFQGLAHATRTLNPESSTVDAASLTRSSWSSTEGKVEMPSQTSTQALNFKRFAFNFEEVSRLKFKD